MVNATERTPSPTGALCGCHACRPMTMEDMRMVLCSTCGNKRCPRANNHRYECSGSNALDQPGSAYSNVPYDAPVDDQA